MDSSVNTMGTGSVLAFARQEAIEPIVLGINSTFFSKGNLLTAVVSLSLMLTSPKHFIAAGVCALIACGLAKQLNFERFGLTRATFAVNGFFLGLAIAAFSQSWFALLLLCLVMSPLIVFVAALIKRLLMPWNLPILVLPYLVVVWSFWYLSGSSALAWFQIPPSSLSEAPLVHSLVRAYFFGFSEILFVENAYLGAVIAMALVVVLKRTGVEMLLAAVYALAMAHILKVESWMVMSGLTIFPAVLTVGACNAGFAQLSPRLKWPLVLLAPLAEIVALKFSYMLGIPALSLSFVWVLWAGVLLANTYSEKEKIMWSRSFINN